MYMPTQKLDMYIAFCNNLTLKMSMRVVWILSYLFLDTVSSGIGVLYGFRFSGFTVSWVNLLGAILSPTLFFILPRLKGLRVICM